MKEIEKHNISTFISQNRTKLDEALVSLRFMKEVDEFLDTNEITQREFAEYIGYSEAFISQLMSGTKKVNTSFINRLEKTFDLIVKFSIEYNARSEYFTRFYNTSVEFNIDAHDMHSTTQVYTFQINDEQIFDPFTEL